MTVYALMEYNDIFSRGAALSPWFELSPDDVIKMIKDAKLKRTDLYMDFGKRELRNYNIKENFLKVSEALYRKGVMLTCRIVPQGEHNEASWEKQIPVFMKVLFYGND